VLSSGDCDRDVVGVTSSVGWRVLVEFVELVEADTAAALGMFVVGVVFFSLSFLAPIGDARSEVCCCVVKSEDGRRWTRDRKK